MNSLSITILFGVAFSKCTDLKVSKFYSFSDLILFIEEIYNYTFTLGTLGHCLDLKHVLGVKGRGQVVPSGF